MQSEEQIGRFGLPWSQCRSRQGVGHENDHAQAKTDEEADSGLIKALMLADDLCIEVGETLYAVAFGFK